MRATVKMHRDTNRKPDWSQALPGMVFDWHGSPRLVVPPLNGNGGKVYTLNLVTGCVTWAWSLDMPPRSETPVFLGYATDIEVTVKQEPVAA